MNLRQKFLLGSLIILICACLIVYTPKWQLSYYHSTISKNTKDYIELEDKLRKTWIQLLGGVIVILGLYFTYRRIKAFEEGQITERYTRAIDQLGSVDKDGKINLEIRIGGIYALERIAKDSQKDHKTIMEVLCAYVRENAPYKQKSSVSSEESEQTNIPKLPADIQAILNVVGRRELSHEEGERYYLYLEHTDLRKAHLWWAKLKNIYLKGVNLQGAYLVKANLQDSNLLNGYLQGADLKDVNLQGAYLVKANLQDSNLLNAYLKGADLKDVKLRGANLAGVNLQGAKNLTAEQLCKAKTLYKAKLETELFRQVDDKCRHLLITPPDEDISKKPEMKEEDE